MTYNAEDRGIIYYYIQSVLKLQKKLVGGLKSIYIKRKYYRFTQRYLTILYLSSLIRL